MSPTLGAVSSQSNVPVIRGQPLQRHAPTDIIASMIDPANAPGKQSQERKALLCAILVLAGSTALATIVSRSRQTVLLGVRIAPRGWNVSVRPPARWRAMPDAGLPDTLVFEELIDGHTRRLALINRRTNPDGTPPERIAAKCLQEVLAESNDLATPIPPRSHASRFGPFAGVTVEDNRNGVLVLAANVDSDAYCIAVIAGRGRLSQRDRRLASTIGSSVQRED